MSNFCSVFFGCSLIKSTAGSLAFLLYYNFFFLSSSGLKNCFDGALFGLACLSDALGRSPRMGFSVGSGSLTGTL